MRAARQAWAIAVKDARIAATEKMTLVQAVTLPLNYLVMMVLFALAGSHAPAAVVMLDHGPYARQLAAAIGHARTFDVTVEAPAREAAQMRAGTLVAAVIIPAAFDRDIRAGRPAPVGYVVNNLNQDLTDDADRGMRLALAQFDAAAAPGEVPFTVAEHDQYASDTGYVPFLAMSVLVIGVLAAGMLQAGAAAAREFEESTMTGLLLAPVRPWQVLAGRLLGSAMISLPSVTAVAAVVILAAGDRPANALLAAATCLLILVTACAAGTALGTWTRDRAAVAVITRGIPVPLLFLSGVFAPLSYMPPAVRAIGGALPVHPAVVLTQDAFRGLATGTLPLPADAVILGGTALALAGLAAVALRRMTWARLPAPPPAPAPGRAAHAS